MLYDSNSFKSYFFVFQNLSMCHTYIYILLALRQNLFNINFWTVFDVFGTVEAVFTEHVQPMAQTCPGLRFPAYIRGLSAPLRTLGPFFSLFHSISYGVQGLSR
jgi:hypothetical protein